MRAVNGYRALIFIPGLLWISVQSPAGEQADDRYLAGYAAAILQTRFGLREAVPRVENAVLVLYPATLAEHDPEHVAETLRSIEGLRVRVAGSASNEGTRPGATTAPKEATDAQVEAAWLPQRSIFDPLLADPRWPHFSVSLQFYQDDDELETVGSANMGASFPIYGWRALESAWQVGIQAGVFSIFDLQSESTDLVNTDYFVGVPLTLRYGKKWSAQARVFHQSSHLGDEFLLRNRIDRINLSYEALDVLVSLDAYDWLRIYGGGGRILRSEPDLEEYSLQGGIELTGDKPLFNNLVPVLALDVQASEEADWEADYSLRAGFELREEALGQRRLQFMFEYFNGRSPNGQFFEPSIEYVSGGVHFYF